VTVRAAELLEQAEAWLARFHGRRWPCERLIEELAARLRDALTVVEAARELRARSEREPLGVDISDYSDEYCIAFLAGQTNALDAVFDAGPAAAEEAT
jgi:hypothetical protein